MKSIPIVDAGSLKNALCKYTRELETREFYLGKFFASGMPG